MSTALFGIVSLVLAVGALTVVMTRDVMRLALGLGAILLAAAGLFALYGFGFLALAEVFIYAGGVLVVMLFAIMLVHRAEPGTPALTLEHNPIMLVACAGLFGFLVTFLRPLVAGAPARPDGSIDTLGRALMGELLVPFELAGLLLLAALVVVVSVTGGERR